MEKHRIKESWLKKQVEWKFTHFSEEMGSGAYAFFEDLKELGLINEERIIWDLTGPASGAGQEELFREG